MRIVSPDIETTVSVPADGVRLAGTLALPARARGVVLFAHGSGSGRMSPRNRHVAGTLQRAGLGTLLLDLLSLDEEARDRSTGELRFDIDLLARRVAAATDWLVADERTSGSRIGYFGASTGAAAALQATAQRPDRVGAIVSRGGRPDLANRWLPEVTAPTLLIVGGNDTLVIEMNQGALERLEAEKRLEIIPEASHLFEEPGALDRVATLARDWFLERLA
jgi:putative phosphoribosyl transferase